MARASWKYHFFREREIGYYSEYLSDDVRPYDAVSYRHNTITKLNYFIPVSIYTGKWWVDKNFTKYHTSFKIGQFTKTRKPYYFRSKKKKNVTKKNYLSRNFKHVTAKYKGKINSKKFTRSTTNS